MLRDRPVDRTAFFFLTIVNQFFREIIQSKPSNVHVNLVIFKHNIKSSLKSGVFSPSFSLFAQNMEDQYI